MKHLQLCFYVLLLMTNVFFISCKKDKTVPVANINCFIDSVTFSDGFSFHFKYKGDLVDEIRSYQNGQPWHIITHTYSGNLLLTKTYFYIPLQSVTRKYEHRYTNGLLTSFTHYTYNLSLGVYEKYRSTSFQYNSNQLSSARISYFTPTDSLNPSSTGIYTYFGRNNNVDSAYSDYWIFNGYSYKYRLVENQNLLRKNYLFLIDPITIHKDLLFEPIYLPVLLNEKYTITITKSFGLSYSEIYQQIRVGDNNFGLPIFASWDIGNTDFHYKCK